VSKKEVDHYFRITFKKDFNSALKVSTFFSTVMYFNYFYHILFYLFKKNLFICFSHSPYFHAEIGSQSEEQKKDMFKLLTECNKLLAKTNVKETNGGKEIKEKGSFKQATDRTRLDFLKIIRSMVANSCVFYTEPLCSGLFSNCKHWKKLIHKIYTFNTFCTQNVHAILKVCKICVNSLANKHFVLNLC
jgi:hypothetical protein